MDSEHRHELKTNELALWLANLPTFLKENARTIIGVVLIAAAVMSYFYFKATKRTSTNLTLAKNTALMQKLTQNKADALNLDPETAPLENAFASTANDLQNAVNLTQEPDHATALMLIKKGEALRSEIHFSISDLEQQVIDDQIEQARKAYEQALEMASGNSTFTAMATYGLALCAEELSDFEKAKQIYTSITKNPDFEGTLFPAQAKFRLEIMKDNMKNFTFAKAPEIKIPEGMNSPEIIKAIKSGQIYIEQPDAETAKPAAEKKE